MGKKQSTKVSVLLAVYLTFAAVVIIGVLAVIFWPRQPQPRPIVSVHEMIVHPERFQSGDSAKVTGWVQLDDFTPVDKEGSGFTGTYLVTTDPSYDKGIELVCLDIYRLEDMPGNGTPLKVTVDVIIDKPSDRTVHLTADHIVDRI